MVRNVLRLAHTSPISKQCGSDNAITSRAARIGCPNARSVGTGRHHMAGSTPKRRNPRGIFHPRSVRPRPPHRRRGLVAARITFAPDFKSRVEAHNHIHGIAPCPPGISAPANGATGCSLGERQNPSWIPNLTGILKGYRACDSFKLIARSRCVFVPDRRPAHA